MLYFIVIHPSNTISQVKVDLCVLNLWSALRVNRPVVWLCVMGIYYKGRQRGREDTRDPCKLLRVIIWWHMVAGCHRRHDISHWGRITLSHFSTVYLSAQLCLTTPSLTLTHPPASSVLERSHTRQENPHASQAAR